MKKRLFSMVLMTIMVATLVIGCSNKGETSDPPQATDAGGQSADTNDESANINAEVDSEELPAYKIGVILYSITDTLGLATKGYAEFIGEGFNIEFQFVVAENDEGTVEAVESLCNAGVDGILTPNSANSLPKIMELCEKSETYFGFIHSEVGDPDIYEQVKDSPYFLGGTHEDEYNAGYRMAMVVMEEYGCRKLGVVSLPAGMTASHDARFQGILDATSEVEGAEIVAEARTLQFSESVTNMLGMDTEPDSLLCTGAGLDYGVQPIAAAGKTGEIKLGTIDIGEGTREALEEGAIHSLSGGQFHDIGYTFIVMYNAFRGTPLIEEPADMVLKYISVNSVEEYDEYMKYCEGDIPPYTIEELKGFVKVFNPNATYEMLKTACENYSLEDVKERHADLF